MKIVSGGQTGVDRAALDVALDLGISCGGWCPQGRRSEDGRIPDKYPLKENESPSYMARTYRNVVDSDATLIVVPSDGHRSSGTRATIGFAQEAGKPVLVAALDQPDIVENTRRVLKGFTGVLNVAGPRESSSPGIGELAYAFLRSVLEEGTT